MTASQAAQPLQTGGADDSLDPWRHDHDHHHHGASSGSVSDDRLTPDSDSDDDTGPGLGLMGASGDGEVYEMKERRHEPGGDTEAGYDFDHDHDHDFDHDHDHDQHASSSNGSSRAASRGRRATSTASTAASFQLYTPDEERAVVSKFDRRLVPFLALLYMLSFLDRSNIGNARVAGMDEDLMPASSPSSSSPSGSSDPTQADKDRMYQWALTAFYLSYIAFEWMSLLWKVVPAHVYVSLIVLSWGCIASLQAVAVGYPMLIALRTLLGVGEAAFTGVPFYLSFFYRRGELAFRTAMFVSAAPLATTFASSLGWAILKFGEGGPIAPWRLLFLVEGFPSVLVAVIAWRVIPDRPETAYYLTARERRVARLRLRQRGEKAKKAKKTTGRADGGATSGGREARGLDARSVLSVLGDPAAWLTGAIFFLANMAYSSLPVFLPTILTQMGHSATAAQALAAPPYLAAFLTVLATAHASDRAGSRSPLLIAAALASAAGYAVLALSSTLGLARGSLVRYLAVYPAAAGFFAVVVLTIAWSVNNQPDESRRGGGFALLQVLGQCGPLVGARLYPGRDAPFYTPGMSACAAAMLGVAVLASGLRVYLGRLNARLDEEEGVEVPVAGEEQEEEEGLVGGRARERGRRRFRYML